MQEYRHVESNEQRNTGDTIASTITIVCTGCDADVMMPPIGMMGIPNQLGATRHPFGITRQFTVDDFYRNSSRRRPNTARLHKTFVPCEGCGTVMGLSLTLVNFVRGEIARRHAAGEPMSWDRR